LLIRGGRYSSERFRGQLKLELMQVEDEVER
jgi:hypothetical protein